MVVAGGSYVPRNEGSSGGSWSATPELALDGSLRDTIGYTICLITSELALGNYHGSTIWYTICLITPETALGNYHGTTIGTTFISRYENYYILLL